MCAEATVTRGIDTGGPHNLEREDCPPQILSCCKILSIRLLALQCRKMCFFASTAELYSKSQNVSPRIPIRSTPMTVTEALELHPIQKTEGTSQSILVPVDRMKQKCFQITTKEVRQSQQLQLTSTSS